MSARLLTLLASWAVLYGAGYAHGHITGCARGLHTLGDAMRLLRCGRCLLHLAARTSTVCAAHTRNQETV